MLTLSQIKWQVHDNKAPRTWDDAAWKYTTVDGIAAQSLSAGFGKSPCVIFYAVEVPAPTVTPSIRLELKSQAFDAIGDPISRQEYYRIVNGVAPVLPEIVD